MARDCPIQLGSRICERSLKHFVWAHKFNVEHRISSAYHPQTNGQDEQTNQTLVRALVKQCLANQQDWDLHINSTLYAYRIARQDSSKFSPYFLMYNRHPLKTIDHEIWSVQVSTADEKEAMIRDMAELREQYKDKATENSHKVQDRQKKYYDAKHDSHHV